MREAYAFERADDAETLSSLIGLLTTAVGLLSLIGSVLIFASRSEDFPGWLVALLPLVPLPFIGYGALFTQVMTVRGYVIDRYERVLQTSGVTLGGDLAVPPHILTRRIWHGWRGNIAMGATLGSILAMYIAILIQSFRYASRTEPVLAAIVSLVSTGALIALICVFWLALLPNRFVQRGEPTSTPLYRILERGYEFVSPKAWLLRVLVVLALCVSIAVVLLWFRSTTQPGSSERVRAREAAQEVRYRFRLTKLSGLRPLASDVWLAVFGKTTRSQRCFVIHLDSYVPTTGRRPFQGVASIRCSP